jgi:hypothetical protein
MGKSQEGCMELKLNGMQQLLICPYDKLQGKNRYAIKNFPVNNDARVK